MTKVEIKIGLFRLLTAVIWTGLVGLIIYFYIISWIIGLLHSLVIPIYIWFLLSHRFVFPKRDYFVRFGFSNSKLERERINSEIQYLGKYPHLGQAVFLEEFLLICGRGIIVKYNEIKWLDKIEKQIVSGSGKQSYQITMVIHCIDCPKKEKYRFYIKPHELSAVSQNFRNACHWIDQHK